MKKTIMEYENKEIDIDDFLDEGFIHVRAIIEIAGSPKEFVEELLNDLINKTMLFQLKEFPNIPKEKEKELIEKIKEVLKEERDLLDGEEDRNAVVYTILKSDVNKVEGTPMYSGFIETEILFKDIKELLKFAVNFTPSSLQIIEPTKLKVDNITLQDFLNEIISLLNNLFNTMKNLDAENKLLKEELNKIKRVGLRFKK